MIKEIREIKIAELRNKANNQGELLNEEIDKIQNAKTLKDLGMSFRDAISLLESKGVPIVLSEQDKTISENECDYEQLSDLIFVHKTAYFPKNGVIKTGKSAGAEQTVETDIDGKTYDIPRKSGRETLHFTANCEVGWHPEGTNWEDMRYTIFIPGEEINQEQLVALRGEDTYFKGDMQIPKGAYILVPENERQKLQEENPEMQLLGYEGDPKEYTSALISNMGYKVEKFQKEGWQDEKDQEKLYKLAESMNKSTLPHSFSKEISEEHRRSNIDYLVNVFKAMKTKIQEEPEFLNKMNQENIPLSAMRRAFIEPVIKGMNDPVNKNVCETEGIKELLGALETEGFIFDDEQKEYLGKRFSRENYNQEYEKNSVGVDFAKESTLEFVSHMVGSIEKTIEKEANEKDAAKLSNISHENNVDVMPSAVEATKEAITTEQISSCGNQLEQIDKSRKEQLKEGRAL